ncbi:MAG: class I SAM-dependent methyltransferase [Thermodesulfobacteriota bacterium]
MMEPAEWEKLYRETETRKMPWYYPGLDPDIEAALGTMKIKKGRALDIGTGPGTQAMALARLGFTVTATDISGEAIKLCREKAEREGLSINFQADDILHSKISPAFELILDRGCFHSLPPSEREKYREVVHNLLAPGGVLLLKCFSIKETMEDGPYRFSPQDIRECFRAGFNVLSIKETIYQGTLTPRPLALFVIMRAG